jgi:hypothetical protein
MAATDGYGSDREPFDDDNDDDAGDPIDIGWTEAPAPISTSPSSKSAIDMDLEPLSSADVGIVSDSGAAGLRGGEGPEEDVPPLPDGVRAANGGVLLPSAGDSGPGAAAAGELVGQPAEAPIPAPEAQAPTHALAVVRYSHGLTQQAAALESEEAEEAEKAKEEEQVPTDTSSQAQTQTLPQTPHTQAEPQPAQQTQTPSSPLLPPPPPLSPQQQERERAYRDDEARRDAAFAEKRRVVEGERIAHLAVAEKKQRGEDRAFEKDRLRALQRCLDKAGNLTGTAAAAAAAAVTTATTATTAVSPMASRRVRAAQACSFKDTRRREQRQRERDERERERLEHATDASHESQDREHDEIRRRAHRACRYNASMIVWRRTREGGEWEYHYTIVVDEKDEARRKAKDRAAACDEAERKDREGGALYKKDRKRQLRGKRKREDAARAAAESSRRAREKQIDATLAASERRMREMEDEGVLGVRRESERQYATTGEAGVGSNEGGGGETPSALEAAVAYVDTHSGGAPSQSGNLRGSVVAREV